MLKRGSLNEVIADRIDARCQESLDRIDAASNEIRISSMRIAVAVEDTALVVALVVLVLGLGLAVKLAI